jgi:hypothetical protein
MSEANDRNSTGRILAYLAEQDVAGLYKFIRHFAAAGDVEVLRDVLQAGIPGRFAGGVSPIFAAVAPLRHAGVDEEAKAAFFRDWTSASGEPDQKSVDVLLEACKDAHSAADLIDFGANPNAWLDNGPSGQRTPLSAALDRGLTAVASVMLEHLSRDEQTPLLRKSGGGTETHGRATNLFDALAFSTVLRGSWNSEIAVMDEMREMDIPRTWRREMGAALKRLVANESSTSLEDLLTAPRALLLTEFENGESWGDMLERSSSVISEMWWREDTHDALRSILGKALADGAEIDTIPLRYSVDGTSNYIRGTLLQGAVSAQCAPMVKWLIEAGASLDQRMPESENLLEQIRGATLIDAARFFGYAEIEQILSAANAKHRVDVVLAQTSRHSRTGEP